MAKINESGMKDLGVKPESGKPSKADTEPKTYYPSFHVGKEAGVDLPAGEHHFHIKAKVGVTTHEKAGEKPTKSHDIEVTHIKHMGPAGEAKKEKAPSAEDGLDQALGQIEGQKAGGSEHA